MGETGGIVTVIGDADGVTLSNYAEMSMVVESLE